MDKKKQEVKDIIAAMFFMAIMIAPIIWWLVKKTINLYGSEGDAFLGFAFISLWVILFVYQFFKEAVKDLKRHLD